MMLNKITRVPTQGTASKINCTQCKIFNLFQVNENGLSQHAIQPKAMSVFNKEKKKKKEAKYVPIQHQILFTETFCACCFRCNLLQHVSLHQQHRCCKLPLPYFPGLSSYCPDDTNGSDQYKLKIAEPYSLIMFLYQEQCIKKLKETRIIVIEQSSLSFYKYIHLNSKKVLLRVHKLPLASTPPSHVYYYHSEASLSSKLRFSSNIQRKRLLHLLMFQPSWE